MSTTGSETAEAAAPPDSAPTSPARGSAESTGLWRSSRAVGQAFGRACLSCWHPRVWLWTLPALLPMAGLVAALGWWYWEPALDAVREGIDRFELSGPVLGGLDDLGLRHLRTLIGPMVVVVVSVPVLLMASLLMVALLVVPGLSRHVATRVLPPVALLPAASRGARWWHVLLWSLLCCAVALVALVLSVPLWLVPPLVLLVPPLIWGWLASRVFAYAVLAQHSSREERRALMHGQRGALWCIGVLCGFAATLPSLVWLWGAPALVTAPLLAPLLVWLYTVVFVLAGNWFAYHLLQQLAHLRSRAALAAGSARDVVDAASPVRSTDTAITPPDAPDTTDTTDTSDATDAKGTPGPALGRPA